MIVRLPGRSVGLALRVFACIASAAPAFAQYPPIHTLGPQDVLYRQVEGDIAQFRQNVAIGAAPPPLAIFQYTVPKDQDLFTLSSRLSLPYSTLATLNRLSDKTIPSNRRTILIPNLPGLFVPDVPENELERIVVDRLSAISVQGAEVKVDVSGRTTRFHFYPGVDFDSEERLAFLGILWRFPVPKGTISSPWGPRTSPFTGKLDFHGGVDIAAPEGTDVIAARDGVVAEVGADSEFGNFVQIRHSGGYESFYAHLQRVVVQLNEEVSSGMMIGTVGTTGLSTGPHLHFEIRLYGKSLDPMKYLSGTR